MEGKKISFGFMKTKKVEKAPEEENKEFIECVEEKSIRVIGGNEIKETAPLVIPMKPNTLITAERLKKIAEEVESAMDEPDPGQKPIEDSKADEKPPDIGQETLDQMAVRELLEEAKKEKKIESLELTVPVPAKPVMEGEKESTLDDYEAVPIQDFGMAMLRGMGWQPNKEQSKYKQPQLRPKGLGLGADKVLSENQKKKTTKDNQDELHIVKNAFVKITTGKHSGYYGKVVSLDEENGRVMVDIPIKKETVSLSEFMMHAVTKSEFDRESKVINADSYEQYKRNENVSQKSSKNSSPKVEKDPSSSKKADNDKSDRKNSRRDDDYRNNSEKDNSNGRSRDKDRHRRDSSSSEERSRRRNKDKKRYSSNDSLSSLSDKDKRKNKKRYSSSDSDSPRRDRRKRSPEGKRDIDKKRKGKKKKRDRDRSPNYRKHRK